jgi:hypothetical protein
MYWYTSICLEDPCSLSRLSWTSPADVPPSSETTEEFRPDLVERVRREIAAGTYDTPEKMEAALDRLLDRLTEA